MNNGMHTQRTHQARIEQHLQRDYQTYVRSFEQQTHKTLTRRDQRIGAIALVIILWYTLTVALSAWLLTDLLSWLLALTLSTFALVSMLLAIRRS